MSKPHTPEEKAKLLKFHGAGKLAFQSGKTILDVFNTCETLQADDVQVLGFILGFADGFLARIRRLPPIS